jgi:hypothetical protein
MEREFWVDLSGNEINAKAQESSQLMVDFEEGYPGEEGATNHRLLTAGL